MKEKLKSARKSLVQLASRIWKWVQQNSTALSAAVFVLGVSYVSGHDWFFAVIWMASQAFLLVARLSKERSESERFDQMKNVRRMTKRTKTGVVVQPEDLQSAIAVLADLEDYMGK